MIRGTPSDITNINLNCGHSVDRADNLGKNSDPHCKSNATAGCGIVYWSVEPLPCVKHDASHNFPIACFISRDILLYSLSDAISMKHVDATWTRRCGALKWGNESTDSSGDDQWETRVYSPSSACHCAMQQSACVTSFISQSHSHISFESHTCVLKNVFCFCLINRV